MLPLGHARRAGACGERRREIQVQTNIDAMLESERSRAIGVFHEDHRADRRDSFPNHTVQNASGGTRVTAPIVGIHD